MADLRDLYQEVILDHNRKPRNFGPLEHANCDARGHNPLCGDDYTIRARVEDGVVTDVRFEGQGCAISKAAASMMTAKVKGRSVAEAERFVSEFREMMAGDLEPEAEEHLGHLKVFAGVSQLPNRIKCAVLPWHTLGAALRGSGEASTEGAADEWHDGPADPSEREGTP